jgi:hypothetical protein
MYDTFISYNSADEAQARTVYDFLTSNGFSPFFAGVSLSQSARSDFGTAIDEALAEARNLVVVASSGADIEAGYVQAEWRLFVDEMRARRKAGNIITVLFGATAIAGLPLALRQYQVLSWTDQERQDLLGFLRPQKARKRRAPRSEPAPSESGTHEVASEPVHVASKVPVVVDSVVEFCAGEHKVICGPGVRRLTQKEMDEWFPERRHKKGRRHREK